MASSKTPSALEQIAHLPYFQGIDSLFQLTRSTGNNNLAIEDDNLYFSALGMFVVEYAAAEIALTDLAWKFSGLPDEKARIVFGKPGFDGVVDRIRQLMKLDKRDDAVYKLIDSCITQLREIGEERHKLVHRLVLYERPALFGFGGGHFRVKHVLAKSMIENKDSIITLQNIYDMTIDCLIINLRLMYTSNPEIFEDKTPEEKSFLKRAWRYVPVKPKKITRSSNLKKLSSQKKRK